MVSAVDGTPVGVAEIADAGSSRSSDSYLALDQLPYGGDDSSSSSSNAPRACCLVASSMEAAEAANRLNDAYSFRAPLAATYAARRPASWCAVSKSKAHALSAALATLHRKVAPECTWWSCAKTPFPMGSARCWTAY